MLHCANSTKGIVLLTVLLFLQIFTLLGIFAMQNGFLMRLVSETFLQRQMLMKKSEEILQSVERQVVNRCIIPNTYRDALLSKSLEWWSTTGCAGKVKSYQYYFVFEALAEETCAYHEKPVVGISAYYYRISLLTFFDKREDEKQILQSTVIRMDNATHPCEGKLYRIIPGRQMWRMLI